NYLLTEDRIQHEYVLNYTDMSFLVKDEFAFKDGLYSGYNEEKRSYDRSSWDYAYGDDGFVRSDPTLKDPRCVYNLLKQHYARYTVEMVERICGTPADSIRQVWDMIASTAGKDKAMTILYALGWTQHSIGAQNVRAGTMVQLLLGNIGVAGGGMNALRGHSNIQGLTDIGLMSDLLPGYLTLPKQDEQDYNAYIAKRTQKPLRANQMSFWQNYPKFHVSLMKSWWGDAATADNNWCFDYLPKLDKPYDMLQAYELMNEGKIHGYICQGFNPLASAPNKGKLISAFSKLKFMVSMDPLETETIAFWQNHGALNDVDPSTIQTEVFRLPTTSFAEENGAVVNSSRWLQWHWKGANPPGEARSDIEIMSELFHRIKAMYEKDGGAWWEPVRDLAWNYANPEVPTPEELAMEYNGKALTDVFDPKDPTRLVRKAGEQLATFGDLRDDGSTASGCWIYIGAWGPTGNMMARRDNSDPTGIGNTLGWAWAWPANRRVMYNRASCDVAGQPFDPRRTLLAW
ncbi:molybdopterin-dependent oxidoreductase, partial [Stenotrophomonas maltophilia]|nr:molybdopterin-dependent oxidoreductase [Stenotrophomonas maltophilia]